MHVPIMIIISPVLWLSARKQRFVVLFISTLISIYFMAKMTYQIGYIKHSTFDVNCTSVSTLLIILNCFSYVKYIVTIWYKLFPK